MKLWSASWANGEPIPSRHLAARWDADGRLVAADNLSPPLAWSDLPPGTQSLVLLASDFDAPAPGAAWPPPPREMAAEWPRQDFFLWVVTDLPPEPALLAEGALADAGVAGRASARPVGRQGRNDHAQPRPPDPGGSAGVPAAPPIGYGGPCPPANDALAHHCVFALFALSVPRLALAEPFGGAEVRQAMFEHVLGSATLSGTCTLNRRLLGLPA